MTTRLAVGLLVAVALVAHAQAQLFSATQRRGAAARRAAALGSNAAVGSIRGNERFVRGNRHSTDFVGTDTHDQRDFIGADGSVSGRVRAATEGLRIEVAPDANEIVHAATAVGSAMYDPRLRVDFKVTPPSPEAMAARLAERLADSPKLRLTSPVSVSVKGQTATLRGEVASKHDRTMAGLLLLLEPGVAEVRNDLTVRSPATAPASGPSSGSPEETHR